MRSPELLWYIIRQPYLLHSNIYPLGHHLGNMPSSEHIPRTISLLPPPPPLIQSSTQSISQLFSNTSALLPDTQAPAGVTSTQHMVGHPLPPIPKKLAERILAGEYVDMTEIPPAKGKVRPFPSPEGGVLLVNAHDLQQQKRLVPDLATWVQCFGLYAAVVGSHTPERFGDLIGCVK